MSLFVTDGNQRSSLAVARAVGQHGIEVTAGEKQESSLAGSSRFCRHTVLYPSPVDSPSEFSKFLLQEMDSGRYRALFPMTDVVCRVVAGLAPQMPKVRIPLPSAAAVKAVQDKGSVVEAAEKVGLACPRTYVTSGAEQLEKLAGQLTYPVVLKPRFSVCMGEQAWRRTAVQYAWEPEDLVEKYHQSSSQAADLLIQELVRGDGRGVFLLVWDGELKAALCHRRIREKPPSGGVSVVRETVALDRELVRTSFRLLTELGWDQGVAMVEFKGDERHGGERLMEINGRFWGSLQLAIDAGMNFPLMLYRLSMGESVAPNFDYRLKVKSRWFLGDLDHLLLRFKNGQQSPGELPSRFRAVVDFLKFYEPGMRYEVERAGDLSPGWFEWKQYFTDVVSSLRGR